MARRPTILCVDDEAVVLESLREQLRRQLGAAVTVETAQNGEEALELLDELRRDDAPLPVVISDHIMPGMKGDALLIEVRSRYPDARTILLTGQASAEAVGRLVNEGALYRYISKPWDHEDLGITVREALRSHETELDARVQRQALIEAHGASQRFVPFEFLALLDRSNLVEVSRDDHVEQELSVFFSDIRGFTELVEGRTPQANFSFINEYLSWMEPPIREAGGFVDSYEGDAVMALFPGHADDAVRAGIASLRALDAYNDHRVRRGERPLRIGIGVNTGRVMLGIIGGRDRIKCGVIGDPVNLAARVEGLTRYTGAGMLITGDTRDRLSRPDAYETRFVDRVRVKGRHGASDVYEVLDGLPAAERERKLATRNALAVAISYYREGAIAGALQQFLALAEADPLDTLMGWYVARCRALAEQDLPSDWDGTVKLERK